MAELSIPFIEVSGDPLERGRTHGAAARHPDDRPRDTQVTVASSLLDLTTGEYRIAIGPACETDYELVPRNLYDGRPPVRAHREPTR